IAFEAGCAFTMRTGPMSETGGRRRVERIVLLGILATVSWPGRVARAGFADSWGYGFYGQLGTGPNGGSNDPVPISGLATGVTAVAAGEYHSLAIKNGGAYSFGYNA